MKPIVKQVYVYPIMSDALADKMKGKLLTDKDVTTLFETDVDVYCQVTKQCIAKFRKNVIPASVQLAAYKNLLPAAIATDARGSATGIKKEGKLMSQKILKDGTLAKKIWTHGQTVNSGVAGYFDRTVREPRCRLTSFNRHHMEKFKNAYPIIRLVDSLYDKLMPEHYKRQRKIADQTSPDFVIPNTSFTTVTVNKNWQTAVHKDAGDFKDGFGNLVALRNGMFLGGHFVVVKWGCAFDLQNGDLLLVDVHQWHGNTPIEADKGATRLSLVMYYRENMIKCGTMKQELDRVKNRKKGDKLND